MDDGETAPLEYKRTPILVAGGAFDAKSVLAQILAFANALPEEIRLFVDERIRAYTG